MGNLRVHGRVRSTSLAAALSFVLVGCGSTVPTGQQQSAAGTALGNQDASLGEVAPAQAVTPDGASGAGSSDQQSFPSGTFDGPAAGAADAQPGAAGGPAGPSEGREQPPSGQGKQQTAAAPREQGPIKIGFITVLNDAGESAGINDGKTYTPRRAFEAVVAASNARGGLLGRPVEPTYVELKSSSSSYSSDLQAACARFVQDEKVVAVLGVLAFQSDQFSACLAKAGLPYVTGDYAVGDDTSVKAASTLVAPGGLSIDERIRTTLGRLSSAGRLTAKDELGVIVEGCPPSRRAAERTLGPTARKLGLKIAGTYEVKCFDSISAFGSQANDMQNAVLTFKSAGATQIFIVSASSDANLFLLFAAAAEGQQFRPKYALNSTAALAVQSGNSPRQQLANVAAVGWLPALDLAKAETAQGQPQQSCRKDLAASGLAPQGPLDRYFAFGACDAFGLYDRALSAAAGDTAAGAIVAGVRSLGTSFSSASTLGGATDFRRGRTGAGSGRVLLFESSCACFSYQGSAFALRD
jgi:hypothetical protein